MGFFILGFFVGGPSGLFVFRFSNSGLTTLKCAASIGFVVMPGCRLSAAPFWLYRLVMYIIVPCFCVRAWLGACTNCREPAGRKIGGQLAAAGPMTVVLFQLPLFAVFALAGMPLPN